jgi:hypothetical protein
MERTRVGLRFRVEYGAGLDYEGTQIVVTDLSGNEVEHWTHQEDPEFTHGWRSTGLRDLVMPKCREMALVFSAIRSELRRA